MTGVERAPRLIYERTPWSHLAPEAPVVLLARAYNRLLVHSPARKRFPEFHQGSECFSTVRHCILRAEAMRWLLRNQAGCHTGV